MRILDLACGTPWLITEPALRRMLDIAMRRDLDQSMAEALRAEREARPQGVAVRSGEPLDGTHSVTMRNGVAIIPVTGPIFRYANLFTRVSGATSTATLAMDIQRAIDDPRVNAILLSIDSPGGEATGISELADQIFQARDAKPIWAYGEGFIASAAYWIGSAVSKLVIEQTTAVGSIGVVVAIDNPAAKTAEEIEIVSSNAPKKRPDVSTDAGRAEYQALVDSIETVFLDAVARNRGVTRAKVLRDFGQGGLLVGTAATRARMVDATGSFEDTLDELATLGFQRRQQAQESRRQASATAQPPAAVLSDDTDEPDVLTVTDERPPAAMEDLMSDTPKAGGFWAWITGTPATAIAPAVPDAQAAPASPAAPAPAAQPVAATPAQPTVQTPDPKVAALEATAAEQAAQLKAAQDTIAAMQADARTQRLTALASTFHGETAAHVKVLGTLADAGGEDGEAFTAYVTLQKASAEAVKSGKLFSALGTDASAAGGDPAEQFMAAVKAKQAATPSMSLADAMSAVAKEQPALYEASAAASSIKVG